MHVLLNNLGRVYQATGDYAKAEPLYREALQINRKVLGEHRSDLSYATGLNDLGTLYYEMGDYAKAESLYRKVLRD